MFVRTKAIVAAALLSTSVAAQAQTPGAELRQTADSETIWRGLVGTRAGSKTSCFMDIDACFRWVAANSGAGEDLLR